MLAVDQLLSGGVKDKEGVHKLCSSLPASSDGYRGDIALRMERDFNVFEFFYKLPGSDAWTSLGKDISVGDKFVPSQYSLAIGVRNNLGGSSQRSVFRINSLKVSGF